jgi:hypothetical protein
MRAYSRSEEILASKKAELINFRDSIVEKKKEYMRWIEAEQDMNLVGEKYFYHGERSIHHIRQTINELLRNTGVKTSNIKYDYPKYKDEKFMRISISFDIIGTYLLIKRFLFEIESLKKFLYVEKITFKNIERARGKIQLGLSLAVYYEK